MAKAHRASPPAGVQTRRYLPADAAILCRGCDAPRQTRCTARRREYDQIAGRPTMSRGLAHRLAPVWRADRGDRGSPAREAGACHLHPVRSAPGRHTPANGRSCRPAQHTHRARVARLAHPVAPPPTARPRPVPIYRLRQTPAVDGLELLSPGLLQADPPAARVGPLRSAAANNFLSCRAEYSRVT